MPARPHINACATRCASVVAPRITARLRIFLAFKILRQSSSPRPSWSSRGLIRRTRRFRVEPNAEAVGTVFAVASGWPTACTWHKHFDSQAWLCAGDHLGRAPRTRDRQLAEAAQRCQGRLRSLTTPSGEKQRRASPGSFRACF